MKCFSHNIRYSLFVLLSCFATALLAAEQSVKQVLEQAESLNKSGQSEQAYQLLNHYVDDFAGEQQYDYLLGKTAIDSGRPLQAIFALERVLDQQPDLAPARAELARAYFLIGENEAAKAEFQQAKKSEMPEPSKQLINSYLSTIDERILGGLSDTSFYLQAGAGYDSNVNSATSTSQIVVPSRPPLSILSPETDSSVGLLQGGGRFSHALKQNLNVYGNANLQLYEAFEESDFSTQIVDGVVGLHFLQGLNQYRISMVGQVFALDGKSNRNLLGLSGQWQRTIDAANQFTLFGQYASLRFSNASRLDVNQLSMGATWLHLFASPYQPITYFTGYYGAEEEQTTIANSDFIGRNYFGLRAGLRFKTSNRLLWSAVFTYQKSEYGGVHPLFADTREDDYLNFIAGAEYLFRGKWSISPEITYSDNNSTLEINSYDRLRAMVTVRKDF